MKQNSILIKILTITLISLVIFMLIPADIWAAKGGGRRQLGFFEILLFPRVWVSAIFCIIGLVLLIKAKVTRKLRLVFLGLIFFVFAIFSSLPLGEFVYGMALHPSPVCSATKPFLFMKAGWPVPVVFLAILTSIAVLTLIGNKLFCGWACPVGAMQELVHQIPLSKKLKIKMPFRVSNTIRIVIFIAFLFIVSTAGLSIYAYFNPFETLHWQLDFIGFYVLSITLIASLFMFRPFCYLICPVGLFTWILEHLAFFKVKINKEKCTECKLCVNSIACPAVPAILDQKKIRPDCHACGRCMEVCPEKALEFRNQ